MPLFDFLLSLLSVHVVVVFFAGVHVLQYKRDSRSALGWLGLIVLFPIAGALLYAIFGINRVSRKAQRISLRYTPEGGRRIAKQSLENGSSARKVGFNVTGVELCTGNSVNCYYNGEQAYPAMLDAIENARSEILLSSYIFDNDESGRRFVLALSAAKSRGVVVRILLDDVGIRYSFPTIVRELKSARLPFKRFMPLRLLPPSLSLNLRTHRKLLIADRSVVFAGGMNIGNRQLLDGPSPHRASDLHFRLQGPIVPECTALFAEDWLLSGGDKLPNSCPAPTEGTGFTGGTAEARLISDGPDETLDSLKLVIMSMIARAQHRVWIMTPYFLPDQQLAGSLSAAALAGVDVRIMIPQKNNWPVVQWALQHNMIELLETGVNILQRPPPFAHSKCLLIDDEYSLIGSSNLDPRSLRLNFELGIELFDPDLNRELADHFQTVQPRCIAWSMERIRARGIGVRLRDATAALFGPYL